MSLLTPSSHPSLDESNALDRLKDALAETSKDLKDALDGLSFENISVYAVSSLQGVYQGTNKLFVDVIITHMKKVAVLAKELAKQWSDTSLEIIAYLKRELDTLRNNNNYFNQNFSWSVGQIN